MNTDPRAPSEASDHAPVPLPGPAVSSELRDSEPASIFPGGIVPPFVASHPADQPGAIPASPADSEDLVGDGEILELIDIGDPAEQPALREEAVPFTASESAAEELPDWMSWIEEPEEFEQPAPDAGTDEALADAVGEVADRLERIAASLRQRPVAELLSGAGPADPLDLLITGFVLGYSQRPRRPADADSA